MARNVLHYFHVHDGKGAHGDPEYTYSIVLACDEHEPTVAAREDAEYIATSEADDDERCDLCVTALTADTITDEQIHELSAWARGRVFTEAGSIAQCCGYALNVLSPSAPGAMSQQEARARCAEILNAMAQRERKS